MSGGTTTDDPSSSSGGRKTRAKRGITDYFSAAKSTTTSRDKSTSPSSTTSSNDESSSSSSGSTTNVPSLKTSSGEESSAAVKRNGTKTNSRASNNKAAAASTTVIAEKSNGGQRSSPRRAVSSSAAAAKKDPPKQKKSTAANSAAKKKSATNATAKQKYPIGTPLSKIFLTEDGTNQSQPFKGEVTSYDAQLKLYAVKYEDDDEEEMTEGELDQFVVANVKKGGKRKSGGKKSADDDAVAVVEMMDEDSENEHDDDEIGSSKKKRPRLNNGKKKSSTIAKPAAKVAAKAASDEPEVLTNGKTPRRNAKKKINYADVQEKYDDEVFTEEEDEEEERPKKKRGVVDAKKKGKGGKKKKKDDDEDDAFEPDSEKEEEEEEEEFDSDSDDDDYIGKKKKSTAAAAKKKSAKADKKSTKKDGKKGKGGKKEEGKSMAESFQPQTNPTYYRFSRQEIESKFNFLDPCGMEATDDIIADRIIGEQVEKCLPLLEKALRYDKNSGSTLGSAKEPLVLGTACSGTDAPALALTLVQEQLEKRGKGDLFQHDHVFSCEKEAFKQAYLARNFDSLLYPDIVKLCDDPPKDVYGRPVPLPSHNLFVAGTSCKNFSALRSRKMIDIEEMGCSGETFLAACELLFKEKPKYAVFENVDKAPWSKMSEYITGRVNLSTVGDNSKIKKTTGSAKGKSDHLVFIRKDGQIVVDSVPPQYGVRCGAVVSGYAKDGSATTHTFKWPGKESTCTLDKLISHNGVDKKSATLVLESDVVYCAKWRKVDTKQFGLPQTRQRVYMFVWQPDDGNFDDDLGDYWDTIVKYLESPVRHSLESFILSNDHDIIRVFREALNGPPGRVTNRAVNQAPDFWKGHSNSGDLKHNKIARERLGIEDESRFQTQWGPFGEMQIPPHYWLEYFKCQNQREVDMVDILHSSAARDAECHDSNFASFFWNISQNVSKEKHRGAMSGVAGCISPGGEFFLPHAGRPLLGCEKLLLQGIPYFRLLLGNETEVQLGDMAGNAMSLSVVNATMMAAIMSKQLRRDHIASANTDIMDTLKAVNKTTDKSSLKSDSMTKFEGETTDTETLFAELSSLSKEAADSSIKCTCETSGKTSSSENFLRCRDCSMSCCRDCVHTKQGYQVGSHDINELILTNEVHAHEKFETKLRSIMPANLILSQDGINEIAAVGKDKHRVAGLSEFMFSLHRMKREKNKWVIVYYAREGGVGEAVGEFKITIGEVESRSQAATILGVQGELTSFFPAKKDPLVYGRIRPCARLRLPEGESEMTWLVKETESSTFLSIVGSGTTPSFRVQVGLTDEAEKAMTKNSDGAQKKHFKAAKGRGEERRWLYAENWKEWPEEITIEDGTMYDGDISLGGKYVRLGCNHTFNQNACWIRRKTDSAPELYFLIKPDVSRNGPDSAIISSSSCHDDVCSIIVTLPWTWQPCDALVDENRVKVAVSHWSPLQKLKCLVPKTNLSVDAPKEDDSAVLIKMNGISEHDMDDICCRDDESGSEDVVVLKVHSGSKAQQTVRRYNVLCAAPFLQHAAENGLKYDLEPNASWIQMKRPSDAYFGCCDETIPPRPQEHWTYDEERKEWLRSSEMEASRQYCLALQKAPQCFDFIADRKEGSLTVKCNPQVAAHRAAFALIEGRGDKMERDVSVEYRLLSSSNQTDPVLNRFRLHNCQNLSETSVTLKGQFELYERQKKAVTKMLKVENGEVDFEEIEMYEAPMPGKTGWSLNAKASRTTRLRGGVIADAIGAGKTVISIAIILKGIVDARRKREVPRKSSATLVVVPPALINQWKDEINKFTDELPNVLCIYDDSSFDDITVTMMLEADVVICPVDLLEAKNYMTRLTRVANGSKRDIDIPKVPTSTGQIEKTGAKGVWIPATSQDPYGGANNPNNQKRRNEAARFTYLYHEYINAIRQKSFDGNKKGIPLEYFEYERVFVDEIHECLCTTKDELSEARKNSNDDTGFHKEKNRRAGREFLGITTKNPSLRPLVFRQAIFGLTATPLLDSTNRVIELANLMGNAYIITLSSHWRELERESCRNMFLDNLLEPKQSREIRKNIYAKCQDYLDLACCKNKNEEDMEGIVLVEKTSKIRMSEEEGEEYKNSQSGISPEKKGFAIAPEDFDPTAGHDISKFLKQNARLASRGEMLVKLCKQILSEEGNERTKIVVFADGRIGAGRVAADFLNNEAGLGCTFFDKDVAVEEKNKMLSWYQYADVTEEDKKRPRVLVLEFAHAAGLNLQAECNNMILFTPLYIGDGGTTSDPIADASTELQAIGRVFRPGQPKSKVNVYRIHVEGPNGEECLDGQLIRRNTDKETIQMAVNADD